MRHLDGHLSPQAVSLHEIDGREEARFTKDVRPGVGRLDFELIESARQSKIFKGGRRFGEKNQLQRTVGPIRNRKLNRDHTYIL